MSGVGIEVDAGDVAGAAGLVTLEDEVAAVVVVRVRTGLTLQNEVRVLVGLGLGRLGVASQGGNHGPVVLVAVERQISARVLERVSALGTWHELKTGGDDVRRRDADGLGLSRRNGVDGSTGMRSHPTGQRDCDDDGGTDAQRDQRATTT